MNNSLDVPISQTYVRLDDRTTLPFRYQCAGGALTEESQQ